MPRRLSNYGAEEQDPSVEITMHGWSAPRLFMMAAIILFGGGGVGVNFMNHSATQAVIESRHQEQIQADREIIKRLNGLELAMARLTQRFDDSGGTVKAKFTTAAPIPRTPPD